MFLSFDDTVNLINGGKQLHIAGSEGILRKLPKGEWIGGSTEYFMTEGGGKISDDRLFVTELQYEKLRVASYGARNIANIASDAYDNGFSIVIIPFDSDVHKEYAQNAAGYKDMFLKNIIGWISGVNLGKSGQTPIAVNGRTGEVFSDKAVVMHCQVPENKTVSLNIVNIFSQDESSPLIEFKEEGFSVKNCFINGKETPFADYIAKNGINTQLPLVGDYSGSGVNISFKLIENGVVNFYAPVFSGIKYRIAKSIPDYADAFRRRLSGISDKNAAFSCNCILNFLYGELEGKNIKEFGGPITFGEIAYQLLNQTLVYVDITE